MEAVMRDDGKSDGFLSRWSRRKIDVREGRPLAEPQQAVDAPRVAPNETPVGTPTQTPTPTPTLRDAQQLTPESDFTGFMARGVSLDVKNAAMKKLFADPHFNVMDGMDIYIDDYSQPDPLPLAMLRQMTSAKTLNLFDDAPEEATELNAGDKATTEEPKVVAQSAPAENISNTEPSTHDHADLRLQPDPTARPEGAGSEPV
jgi:Protein of unknown function (DUF3306)